MCNKFALFILVFFAAITAAQADVTKTTLSNGQELQLNGFGAWRSNFRDLFISALYVERKVSTRQAALDESMAKRMEIHLLAKLRPRRFGQIWREYIAINNDRGEWSGMSVDILRFINIFKDNLNTGDVILIDYLPNQAIEVFVNGNKAGEVANPKLMKVLLNAWLGDRPVTPQYKQGLLGQDTRASQTELANTFSIIVPTDGRIAETKNWSKLPGLLDSKIAQLAPKSAPAEPPQPEVVEVAEQPEPQPEPVVQEAKPVVSKPEAKPTEVAQVKPTPKPPVQQPTIEQPRPESVQQVVETEVIAPAQPKLPAIKPETPQKPAEEVASQSTAVDSSVLDVLDEALAGEDASDAADEEAQVSTADVAALYQVQKDYERSLLRWVGQHQKYPVKAYRRGIEGEGRLVIVINRDGEVSSVEMAESTGKRILDRESINTVKRASPLPKMPEKLAGDSFEFSFPIEYTLEEGI